MKITKLVIEPTYDFKLTGIVSSAKEHKLAWTINQLFHINLVKQDDWGIDFLNKMSISVSYFLYETKNSFIRLMRNKPYEARPSTPHYLIPELKSYDYLLLLGDISELIHPNQALDLLKTASCIIFAGEIDVKNLPSRENLLF